VRWDAACESLLPTASPSRTATPSNTASSSGTASPTPSITPSPSPVARCVIRHVVGNGSTLQPLPGAQAATSGHGLVPGLVANGSFLYIGDTTHLRVRRLDLRTGAITPFLGNGLGTGTYVGVAAVSAPVGQTTEPIMLQNGDYAVAAFARCAVVAVSQVRRAGEGRGGGGCTAGDELPPFSRSLAGDVAGVPHRRQ
jgi:hypothetical protein